MAFHPFIPGTPYRNPWRNSSTQSGKRKSGRNLRRTNYDWLYRGAQPWSVSVQRVPALSTIELQVMRRPFQKANHRLNHWNCRAGMWKVLSTIRTICVTWPDHANQRIYRMYGQVLDSNIPVLLPSPTFVQSVSTQFTELRIPCHPVLYVTRWWETN